MRIALAITLALLPALATAQIPVLGVSPRTLVFVTGAGQGQPAPQRVAIDNRGSGPLQWRVSVDADWIRVSPSAGSGAATLTVTIDASRLRSGKHEGRIRIDAADADDSPATINVTAQVATSARASAPPPSAPKVPLTAPAGSKTPATWAFQLDGPGNAVVGWQINSDASWLTAEPASGATPTAVTIKADAGQLAAGGYQGSLQFFNTAGDPLLIVPVFFTVTKGAAPAPAPAPPVTPPAEAPDASAPAEPVALTIDAGPLPPATRNLPYTQAVPVRGGRPPYAMRVVQGRLPVGLALSNGAITGTTRFAGNYEVTVAVTDSATPPALATQALTLRVIILQVDTALVVDPPAVGLTVAGAQGTQRARIGVGSGRQQLDWRASSDAAWLKVMPAAGVSPGVVQIEANATGLAPGTYVATITIVMEGAPNSPARIPVQLTVRK